VKAGLSADVLQHLQPCQLREFGRNPGTIDKCVAHVDIKLKGYGKALFQQPRGDEDTLGVAGIDITMANGPFQRLAVKTLRHQRLVAVTNGQRHKVKGLAVQGRGNGARHRLYDPLQFVRGEHDLARGGIANAVRCLAYTRLTNDLVDAPQRRIDYLTHVIILTYG